MLSHGIYSVILLIFSNVFMTFAWYGHLKMRQEFSWFAALPLIGVIAFSWAIAFFEYCLQVPANRLGFKDSGGPFDIMQLKVIQEVITLAVFTLFSVWAFKTELKWNHLAAFFVWSLPFILSLRSNEFWLIIAESFLISKVSCLGNESCSDTLLILGNKMESCRVGT